MLLHFLTKKTIKLIPQKKIENIPFYNVINEKKEKIFHLFSENQFDQVENYIQTLNKSSQTELYPLLVSLYKHKKIYRSFIKYFKKVLETNICLESSIFYSCLNYLIKNECYELSPEIFKYMQRLNFSFNFKTIQNAIIYFCYSKNTYYAMECINVLEKRNDIPNMNIYSLFFKQISNKAPSEKEKILEKILKNFTPNDHLLTSMIHLYQQNKEYHRAIEIFNTISNPNLYQCTAILVCYVKVKMYQPAEELFLKVLQNKDFKVDGRFFSPILKLYAEQKDLTKIMNLFYLFKKRKQNLENVRHLFDGFSESKENEDTALNLFYKLESFGIKKDNDVYWSLFEVLRKRGNDNKIIELYEEKSPDIILNDRVMYIAMEAYLNLKNLQKAEKIVYSSPKMILNKQLGDKFIDLYEQDNNHNGMNEYIFREILEISKK